MTGVVGGAVGDRLAALVEATHEEPWYVTERLRADDLGVAICHHGERDPGGHAVWRSGPRAGVVYGAVPNADAETALDGLLTDPVGTPAELDGPFLLVAIDAERDRLVAATDRLGTRPCYYLPEPFAVGTSVGALLELVAEPTVDPQGVADLLTIGHVWGEKTLVEEVNYLPSGSVAVYEDGDLRVERYHRHEFSPRRDPHYVEELVESYRRAVADAASTLPERVGLWLSGGLDSRAMAAELSRHRSVTAYTYDANPAGGTNPELARRVAAELDVENAGVDLGPDVFVEAFPDCVDLVDGMVGMSTFVNLSATYALPAEAPGVVIEACGQGGMMGDGIKGSTIRRADSPAAALYEAKHLVDADAVRRVLDSPVEPMATYRREAARSDRESTYATVMDCYYRNYFPRGDFGSNPLARSQFDTRVPLAHREFLDRMTDLPVEYRTRTFPRTRVPVGTSRMKLELVRRLDRGLESIPYERTKLPPTAPEWAHGVGFVARTVADRAAGRITYGGRSMLAAWYREHEGFARLVDDLVASAAERPIFDAKELHRAREQTRTGERDRTSLLSGVVTAEQWLREHV